MSKFVRTREIVVVTPPGDTDTLHSELAKQDGIHEEVLRLKKDSPDDVDAGLISVTNYSPDGGVILLAQFSTGYNVPRVGSEARLKSAEILRRLSPGYEVTTDADPETPSGSKERE